jgi:hypothetical protein
MVLYDDYGFPTGTVGGQMLAKYPQYVAHFSRSSFRTIRHTCRRQA